MCVHVAHHYSNTGTVPECDVRGPSQGATLCVNLDGRAAVKVAIDVIIEVTDDDRGVVVRDPDDFKRLHVEYRTPDAGPRILADSHLCAGVDEGDARIYAEVLRQFAGSASEPAWHRNFDAMLDYAADKGWYDTWTRIITVHVEYQTNTVH